MSKHVSKVSAASRAALSLLLLATSSAFAACAASDDVVHTSQDYDALSARRPLDVNDVSILFPLPGGDESADDLIPLTMAPTGELLPKALFDALALKTSQRLYDPFKLLQDFLQGAYGDGSPGFAEFRVVAARFDPCFQGSNGCSRQLRLVAQPVRREGGRFTTDERALHLFYELSSAEFGDAVRQLVALEATWGAETNDRPLGVHPVMASQGLRGEFSSRVKSLIVANAGLQSLVRATYQATDGTWWGFTGLDVDHGDWVQTPVPTLAVDTQWFDTSSHAFEPRPRFDDSPAKLFSNMSGLPQAERDEAFAASNRVESPEVYHTGSMDCASCHVSGLARKHALESQSPTNLHDDEWTSLAQFAQQSTNPVSPRAFGYQGADPVVSQRTANETAAVAEALNRMIANGNFAP